MTTGAFLVWNSISLICRFLSKPTTRISFIPSVNSPSKNIDHDFAAAFLHGLLPTVYIRCFCQKKLGNVSSSTYILFLYWLVITRLVPSSSAGFALFLHACFTCNLENYIESDGIQPVSFFGCHSGTSPFADENPADIYLLCFIGPLVFSSTFILSVIESSFEVTIINCCL